MRAIRPILERPAAPEMKAKPQSIRAASAAPAKPRAVAGKAAVKAALESARQVLKLEAEGVAALSRSLERDDGAAFGRAIAILEAVTGRVIVTGMGKSGHVARKIAATMASTGTPSQFVHPAEASHGDLGMITEADAVLGLSLSGDTAEMSDMLAFTRRFRIPLIGMTSGAQSALAQAADVALLLPPLKEACPLGLAPTTSTTVMLAFGDALAVALYERKGFSADDFHQFHPRGALGRRFLRVSDLMHRGAAMPVISLDAPLSEAIVEISAKRLGCVGVTDSDGRLAGIVTDGDLRRCLAPRNGESAGLLHAKAGKVMTRKPLTIRPQALAAEALGVMNARAITTLFVVENPDAAGPQVPVGILHIHDILRAGVA